MKRKKPSTSSTNVTTQNDTSTFKQMSSSSLRKKRANRHQHTTTSTGNSHSARSHPTTNTNIDTSSTVTDTSTYQWKPIELSELTLFSDQSNENYSNSQHRDRGKHVSVIHLDQNHYDNDDEDDQDHGQTHHDDFDDTGNRKKSSQKKKIKTKKLNSTKVIERELLGQPHEPMGIFFSLEVMDGTTASSLLRKSQDMSTTTVSTGNTSNKEEHQDSITKTTKLTTGNKKKKNQRLATNTTSDIPFNDETKVLPVVAPNISPSKSQTTSTTSSKRKRTPEMMDKKQTNGGGDVELETTSPSSTTNDTGSTVDHDTNSHNEVIRVQNVWFKECNYSVELHTCLCHTLVQEQFHTPTLIQAMSLPATILGQQNFVGAAPTGSGKTLAFLLPIFHTIYTLLDDHHHQQQQQHHSSPLPLQALIVTPTRELALQIYHVGMKFCIAPSSLATSTIPNAKLYSNVSIACITGGLASAKQIRILQSKYRPPTILVGTPGRLWELISSQQYEHLNHLSQLRFLVIDEADQMVDMKASTQKYNPKSRYKFPELIQILDVIHKANPMMDDDEDDGDGDVLLEEDADGNDMDTNRMFGLPGIPGEARVTMMNDTLLQRIREQQQLSSENDSFTNEDDGEEDDGQDILIADYNVDTDLLNKVVIDDDDDISLPVLPPVRRQTFVFSATLTLPESHSLHSNDQNGNPSTIDDGKKKSKKKHKFDNNDDGKNKKGNVALSNVHGAIADLLQKAHAAGRTKVVDLTNGTDMGQSRGSSNVNSSSDMKQTTTSNKQISPTVTTKEYQFPPGLQFQQMLCTQRHKDSHLYGYILHFMSLLQQPTQKQTRQSSILIFCNSIAGVRRVGMTLTTLRLPVRMLHANMQQVRSFCHCFFMYVYIF